jgi:hypothetical protein
MKSLFKPRNTISAVEAEIGNLGKRRAEISTCIVNAELALAQAREERRESLSTNADFDEITTRIRDLGNQLADLQTVVADIDEQTSHAADRLAKARDVDARAASASALEKIASAAEQRAPEIEKAAAAFSKVVEALKAELGDTMAHLETHLASRPAGSIDAGKAYATGREIAAAIAAEALAKALPELFEMSFTRHGYQAALYRVMDPRAPRPNWESDHMAEPISVSKIIAALVSSPLRERAASIRAGGADILQSVPQLAADPYVPPSAPANVNVFVTDAFSYVGSEFGGLEVVGDGWVRSVPEPVADVAERRDLCVRATSPRGVALLEAARGRKGDRVGGVKPEDCVQLGDVMGLHASEDEGKRRAKA